MSFHRSGRRYSSYSPVHQPSSLLTHMQFMTVALADSVRAVLYKYYAVQRELPVVINAVEASWTEERDRNYEPVYYTAEVCTQDSDNRKRCTDEWRSKEVYVDTDHYYWFHPEQALRASILLSDFISKYPDMKIDQDLAKAATTHAENEKAIRSSLKKLFKERTPSAEEILGLANACTGQTG